VSVEPTSIKPAVTENCSTPASIYWLTPFYLLSKQTKVQLLNL